MNDLVKILKEYEIDNLILIISYLTAYRDVGIIKSDMTVDEAIRVLTKRLEKDK